MYFWKCSDPITDSKKKTQLQAPPTIFFHLPPHNYQILVLRPSLPLEKEDVAGQEMLRLPRMVRTLKVMKRQSLGMMNEKKISVDYLTLTHELGPVQESNPLDENVKDVLNGEEEVSRKAQNSCDDGGWRR
uniref:Ovule protein n=1 Tax=Rhabditophanes sp. KR3021 TaxID=114890 RepID=A0AC35UDQ1_9BILA